MKKSMQRPVLMGIFSALHFSAWINLSNDSEAILNEKTVARFAFPFIEAKISSDPHPGSKAQHYIVYFFVSLFFCSNGVTTEAGKAHIYHIEYTYRILVIYRTYGKRPYIYTIIPI